MQPSLTPAEMKAEMASIAIQLEALRADREAAGKSAHGVYIRSHSDECIALDRRRTELLFAYRATEEGINEDIDQALKKGPIWYAAVHPVSPSSIQLYRYDETSPTKRSNSGNIENNVLAMSILAKRGISTTASNATIPPNQR